MTINCQQKNNSITSVGERIKRVRKDSGLSQVLFAEKLDVSQGFIGHIENGRNQPTVDLLMRIAIIFGCDGHWLLTGEGKDLEKATSQVQAKIDLMLEDMTEEQQRDVLKYCEMQESYEKMRKAG